MDPIVKLVTTIINKIPEDEMSRIKSVTGLVVLIVKIIEKSHKKKKLSYDDSKRLFGLVIDTLIHSLSGRSGLPPEVYEVVTYAQNNREDVKRYVEQSIDVWDALVPVTRHCGCGRKQSRIKKSIITV